MSQEHSLNPCNPGDPTQFNNQNPVLPPCQSDSIPYQDPDGNTEFLNYKDVLENIVGQNPLGLGEPYTCDPFASGKITNDDNVSEVIFGQRHGLRAIDEAMWKMFQGLLLVDTLGKFHKVPIIWGNQEAAVAAVTQKQYRKDLTLVTDRIMLPIMSIISGNITSDVSRYIFSRASIDYRRNADGTPGVTYKEKWDRDTILGFTRGLPLNIPFELNIWTMFERDMKDILEQILNKFNDKVAYLRLRDVFDYDNIVIFEGANSADNRDVNDQEKRVLRTTVNMTVQAFIPQPIFKKKSALKTMIEFTNGTTEDDITQLIARIEYAVGELKGT